MKVQFSVPSKTFFLGEYLALEGGPSIVVNTNPRFTLSVSDKGQGLCDGIHPSSPAGQWIRQNSNIFEKYDLVFNDPHSGAGGLGASSAQFALVYLAQNLLEKQLFNFDEAINVSELWNTYRSITKSSKGASPSGADVVAQVLGDVGVFSSQPVNFESLKWDFEELDFAILRTNNKLKTHEHLEAFNKKIPVEELRLISVKAKEAIRYSQSAFLIEAIEQYSGKLLDLGLVTEKTQPILEQLSEESYVKTAKGCGAMGADTVLVLLDKNNMNNLIEKSKELKLEFLATSKDLSPGFQVLVSYEKDQEYREQTVTINNQAEVVWQ